MSWMRFGDPILYEAEWIMIHELWSSICETEDEGELVGLESKTFGKIRVYNMLSAPNQLQSLYVTHLLQRAITNKSVTIVSNLSFIWQGRFQERKWKK